MAELKQLEFFLLRYVPDAVKGEFVNIGLLVREVGEGERFRAIRITENWSRVRCIDPEADLEVLTGMGLQLKRELEETDWSRVIHKIEDLFANGIQISPVKACLADDPAKETEMLVRLYLQTARHAERSRGAGRQAILRGMEEAFESAGVLALLRRGVALAEYTGKKGDPLKFDFGYAAGGEVKFLQAVSLQSNVQQAVALGARFPAIARDVLAVQGAAAHLTAVIEDDADRGREEIGFALGLMEESRIRIATVGEMAGIAAEARRELRA
jgi:hypothetical protein